MRREILTEIFLIWVTTLSFISAEDGRCQLLPGPRDDDRSIGYSCVETTFDHVAGISDAANWIEFSVSKLRIPEKAFARFSLHTLSFHKCDFEYIHPNGFAGLVELQRLTIWKSNIHILTASWFKGLYNLNHLLLENTGIVYIEPQTFLEIPNLRYLNIEDNNLNCLPEHALAPLRKLKHLHIGKNPWLCQCYEELVKWMLNRQIDFGTRDPSMMKYGCMSGWYNVRNNAKPHQLLRNSSLLETAALTTSAPSRGSCTRKTLPILTQSADNQESIKLTGLKISSIPEFAFFQFGNSLRNLDMSGCSIEEIHPEAFAGLPKLTQLILSNNSIATIKPEWFKDLRGLRHLRLDRNGIKNINSSVFLLLDKLETLSLEQNGFECLHPNTFGLMKNLKRLNIGKNPWNCTCLNEFRSWLDKQQIAYSVTGGQCTGGYSQTAGRYGSGHWNSSFEENFTASKYQSKNYSENHGTYTEFHYDFPTEFDSYYQHGKKRSGFNDLRAKEEQRLKRRNAGPNCQTSFDPQRLERTYICPPACRRVEIRSYPTRYFYECSGGTLASLNAIPDVAESITFQYSTLDVITNYAFARFGSNLQTLKFTDCRISTIEPQAFAGLINLQELVMRGNNIHEVKSSWFESSSRLRRIILTHNHISRIENGVFQLLPNLEHLMISDNQLNCIGIDSLNYMESLRLMDVHNNPWSCLCRKKLIQWLDEHKIVYDKAVSKGYSDWNCPDQTPAIPVFTIRTTTSMRPPITMRPTIRLTTTTKAPIVSIPPPPQNQTLLPRSDLCKRNPPNSNSYTCVGGDMFVLDEIPSDAERIEIRNSIIFELEADSFARFKNLKELLFYNCGIGKIDDFAFRGLHKLKLLVFQGCGISITRSAWFHDLNALTELDLSSNHMTEIEPDVFTYLPNLRVLHIEDNEIKCIYTYSLSAAKKLEEISLQNNPWKWRCIEELVQYFEGHNIRYTDFRTYQGKRIDCEISSEINAEELKASGTTNTSISTVNVLCVSIVMLIFTKF